LGSSINDSEKLNGEVSKMVTNVSALNNVYGNMLAAMGAKN
jgi:hypothetical protein